MEVTAALGLLLQLTTQAQQIAALINKARAEGRETISEEDMIAVVGADDDARARLVAAIEAAKAAGN